MSRPSAASVHAKYDWLRGRIMQLDLRYQRAAWTSLIILVGRLLNILTALLTIPLLSRYLGGELFGLWMMITNFISFLVFADLGVGVGFQNQLIRCFATDNKRDPGVWVANAMIVMLAMAATVVAMSVLVVPLLPFDRLIAVTSPEARYWITPAAVALGISFAFGLPAVLIEYIGNAYQRGYWAHGLTAIGRFTSLIGICIACYLQFSIVPLIVLFVATPHVASWFGFCVLWRRVPWLRPDFGSLSIARIRQLLLVGFGMLGVRITHAIAMQGPVLLIAMMYGLTEAGTVAVIQKLLTLPLLLTQPILIAMQGAIGEAAHKGQWLWVGRNLARLSLITCVVFSLTTLVVVAWGGKGLLLLLDSETAPSRLLLLLLCIYTGMATVRAGFSTFLTVLDRVFYQSMYRFAALLIAFLFVYLRQPGTTAIILCFVLIAELPQLMCTVGEAHWVLRRGQAKLDAESA